MDGSTQPQQQDKPGPARWRPARLYLLAGECGTPEDEALALLEKPDSFGPEAGTGSAGASR